MPKRSRLSRVVKATVKETGKNVLVKDYGEHFHPRYWSKTTGYSPNELKFKK